MAVTAADGMKKIDISGPFSKPWKNSDAVLIVEGNKLHVHTSILSMVSPVFETMFNSGFKESITKEVELKDKKYDLVEIMLKMIYPQQNVDLLSIQIMQGVLEISKEYMIDSIKHVIGKEVCSMSKTLLINGDSDTLTAMDLMKLAESGDFQEAMNNCFTFIANNNQYSKTYCTLHGIKNMTIEGLCKEKCFSRDTQMMLMCRILNVEIKKHHGKYYRHCQNQDEQNIWNDMKIISDLLVKM